MGLQRPMTGFVREDKVEFNDSEIQALFNFVKQACVDADKCFGECNKSAGKRARSVLLSIQKMCKPIRKRILDTYKGGDEEDISS